MFAFDRALIATGSSPVKPPIPGLDSPFVHPCWTLHDARSIMQLARRGARVLQMGAGFIGCIILEALAKREVELTVVEMGDRMVPRMMGPGAGNMIKHWCEQKGVTVYTSTRVEGLEPASNIRAKFSNGKTQEFDLVIQATGVRPNIGFLANSPIKALQGVLTDEHMQTTVEGIYAAGDCAEAYDPVTKQTIVSAIQPNAVDQGYVAGDQHGRRQRHREGRHADQRARHAGAGLDLVRPVAGRAGRRTRRAERPAALPAHPARVRQGRAGRCEHARA